MKDILSFIQEERNLKQTTKDLIASCPELKHLYDLIFDTYNTKKDDILSRRKRRRLNTFFMLSNKMMGNSNLFKTCIMNRILPVYHGCLVPVITHCKKTWNRFEESEEGFVCVKFVKGKGDREEMFHLVYRTLKKELLLLDNL